MTRQQGSSGGITVCPRSCVSDRRPVEEGIGRKTYVERGLKILPCEKWMDCGGNVGAFALLACSLGAKVTVYEPDPFNIDMIKRNLRLNGFKATVKPAALVHDDRKEVLLSIANNSQVWRNSNGKTWHHKSNK